MAKTKEEIELYDSIDSLTQEEQNELVSVIKSSGFELLEPISETNIADILFLQIDLDIFINQGVSENQIH